MTRIISYQKATDEFTTYTLQGPANDPDNHNAPSLTELATIDGVTYVAVPDGIDLPEQAQEIASSIEEVELTPGLREEIAALSTHVALIRERVVSRIRAQYSVDDELKLLRTAPSAEFEVYNAFVEDCRTWGREQKALLGL